MADVASAAEIGWQSDRRRTERRQPGRKALIKQPCLRPMSVELHDISTHGCGIVSDCTLAPGARVLLDLPGLEIWSATVVWWQDGRGGLRFCRPMHPAVAARFAA
jgi:hypothetical protein